MNLSILCLPTKKSPTPFVRPSKEIYVDQFKEFNLKNKPILNCKKKGKTIC